MTTETAYKVGDIITIESLEEMERNNGIKYALMTDSQDLDAVKETIDIEDADQYGLFFALIDDGEYLEVWGCANSIAWLNYEVKKVYSAREFNQKLHDDIRHRDHLEMLEKVHGAANVVVKDLGNYYAARLIQRYDENGGDTSDYGEWTDEFDEYTVDRVDEVLYGPYISQDFTIPDDGLVDDNGDVIEDRIVDWAIAKAKELGLQTRDSLRHTFEWTYDQQTNDTIIVSLSGHVVLAEDEIYVNSRFNSRDYNRYFKPAAADAKVIDAQQIKYMIQEHNRMEDYCSDEWGYVYNEAEVYYKGELIHEETLTNVESDDKTDWLADMLDLSPAGLESYRQDYIKELEERVKKVNARS